MIIVKLIGGLGNQMFQYAVGRHLAMKNKCMLKLDTSGFKDYKLRNYDLGHFNIQENIATSEDLSRVTFPSDKWICKIGKHLRTKYTDIPQIQYINEQTYNFTLEILTLGDNTYLDGYWQSEKYFSDITGVIRDEFIVKNKPDPINESYLGEIRDCESISVHVRRGDYVSNPTTARVHGFLGSKYYYDAINAILERVDNPHFFIFSDDPEWAEKNIKPDAPITCVKHNGAKNYEDLRLMSTCKYHIIANSSFSWWGAWLSSNKDRFVIAPRRWFKSDSLNARDLIPESWHKI